MNFLWLTNVLIWSNQRRFMLNILFSVLVYQGKMDGSDLPAFPVPVFYAVAFKI